MLHFDYFFNLTKYRFGPSENRLLYYLFSNSKKEEKGSHALNLGHYLLGFTCIIENFDNNFLIYIISITNQNKVTYLENHG